MGHDYYRDRTPLSRDEVDGIHGSELIEREVAAVVGAHATAAAAARGAMVTAGDGTTRTPLFLYVASQAPHAGYTGAPAWAYAQVDAMPSASAFSEDRREVAALVVCLERLVRTTVTSIEEGGLTDDTVLIFVSDNGEGCVRVNRGAVH